MKTRPGILKYSEPMILITIGLAVFAAPLLIFQEDDGIIWKNVLVSWRGVLPFLFLFIINHFLLVPFLLFKNRKIQYLFAALALIIGFSLTTFFTEKGRRSEGPPHRENTKPPPPRTAGERPLERQQPPPQPRSNPIPLPPIVNTFIISILLIGFDTGLRMMTRWSKLEQEKTLLEKENIQSQLAFLRNQVSPHFFMNTLNNIHALIDVDSEEAKSAIIKLSKLMRHLLYDSQADLVPLAKEVEFIRSYINLMKLRFSEKVKIELSIPDNLPEKSIPPLLFTSFVENAFKHGISYQKESSIRLEFSYVPDDLTFKIKNGNAGNKQESTASGIGIENSKKRLDIIYGQSYSLIINDNKNDFEIILTIPV